jgi:hypothetical protein
MIYVRPRLTTSLGHLLRCTEHILHAMKMAPGTMNPTTNERALWKDWFAATSRLYEILAAYRTDLAPWIKPKPPTKEIPQ